MIDKSDFRALWEMVMVVAPAPVGALIGLRYAKDQTPRARAVTWLCSSFLACFAGPVTGEVVTLSPNGIAIATMVWAAFGMEVMAGLAFAFQSFARDPFGALGKAFDLAAQAANVFRRGGNP